MPPVRMPADKPLREDQVEWVNTYASEVLDSFDARHRRAANRFRSYQKLRDRFRKAVGAVSTHGLSEFHAVDEAHNELCIAFALLDNQEPLFTSLEYERSLPSCTKSIDFRAEADNNRIVYIDVKTIRPTPTDRWDQYEEANKEGWFGKVNVVLNERWQGGEISHDRFTSRDRMLEHALELEGKIDECGLSPDTTLFVLALCGEGFHWREDWLEDFAEFYFTGRHRPDDPLGKMEAHYLAEKNITLSRSISRFACMFRHQRCIDYKHLNWNVQPPRNPLGAMGE